VPNCSICGTIPTLQTIDRKDNDALIALSCHSRNIPFIASFDQDFDKVRWLRRLAEPDDLP